MLNADTFQPNNLIMLDLWHLELKYLAQFQDFN